MPVAVDTSSKTSTTTARTATLLSKPWFVVENGLVVLMTLIL